MDIIAGLTNHPIYTCLVQLIDYAIILMHVYTIE